MWEGLTRYIVCFELVVYVLNIIFLLNYFFIFHWKLHEINTDLSKISMINCQCKHSAIQNIGVVVYFIKNLLKQRVHRKRSEIQ